MPGKSLSVFLLFMAAGSLAQSKSDTLPAVGTLYEVVVTGQYQPQSLKQSVYQVRTISKERIVKQGATRLQDVLVNELNIRFSQDLALGGANITMMGLSGQNVKILIDGVPMFGRQGTSNEININQVDISTIERVEVVEGPMSVVYGADALAGVINIITKKKFNRNLSVTARLHEETVGKEYGITQGLHNQSINAAWQSNKWQLTGGVSRNASDGWRGSYIGRSKQWKAKEQLLGNAGAAYYASKWNVRYRFDGLHESIDSVGNNVSATGDLISGDIIDQSYISKRFMHQLQSSVYLNSMFSFQGIASYTRYSRQTKSYVWDQHTDKKYYATGPGMQAVSLFTGTVLRGTFLYKVSALISFQSGIDVNLETGSGERMTAGTQHINDHALFLSAEITPSEKINIRPGIRVIKNSVYDAPPVIPSLNTKFTLSRKVDLRLAYARGFRAPSLRELYFYFFDANHAIAGNTDLKAELSHSFNAAITGKWKQTGSLKASSILGGFYNNIQNSIDIARSASNANAYTYINIARYKTVGASLTNNVAWKNLAAAAGVSYTGCYNQHAEANKTLPRFTWSTEVTTTLSYAFPSLKVDINLFYKYTGKLPQYQLAVVDNQEVVQLAETAGYHLLDGTVTKKIGNLFTLNAGVRNVFDVIRVNNTAAGQGAHNAYGQVFVSAGRCYFAGLLFSWN